MDAVLVPMAALTNYDKLDGLKYVYSLILPYSQAQKSVSTGQTQIKVSNRDVCSLNPLGENLFLASCFLVATIVPWLVATSFQSLPK